MSEGNSIEDAVNDAIKEVTKTVQGVKQLNIVSIEAIVEKNKVKKYRVNSNITFVLNDR